MEIQDRHLQKASLPLIIEIPYRLECNEIIFAATISKFEKRGHSFHEAERPLGPNNTKFRVP